MFNSAILDVAIGLFLMYLVLSMITTVIQEAIANVLKLRASNLFRGIENILDDKKYQDLAEKVYKHPMIYRLYEGDHRKRKILWLLPWDNGPAYIPSETFVTALLDTLRDKNYIAAPAGQAKDPDYLQNPRGFAELIKDSKNIIASLPAGNLRTSLMMLVSDAEGEIGTIKHRLEGWFDSSMDRVGGWYKRTAQFLAIGIGIIMAVSLNADSINVMKRLWEDQPLRAAIAAHAGVYMDVLEAQQATAAQPPPSAPQPVPAAADNPAPVPKNGAGTPATSFAVANQDLNKMVAELQHLPVGWKSFGVLQDQQSFFVAIVGWLLTGFAISLGASFWFNTLGQVLQLRATGVRIPTQMETGKTVPPPLTGETTSPPPTGGASLPF